MPLIAGPTIPYPSAAASGAQSSADWCASMLAAHRSHIEQIASAVAVLHVCLMQRQWIADGGGLATYPLPVASGPAIALGLYATPSSPLPDAPSPAFLALATGTSGP